MSYLGVSEAARARLEGKPFDFISSIENLPLREQTSGLPPTSKASVPLSFNRAPGHGIEKGSFLIDVVEDGPDWIDRAKIYPSISFSIIDVSPRYNDSLTVTESYPLEDYYTPIATTAEPVLDEGKSVGSGARMVRRQTREEPFNFMLEIRAHAKKEPEAIALIKYVYAQFKPRGYIRVPRLDGSWCSWDMYLSDYSDRDAARGQRTHSNEKDYLKVWTYVIEGYEDTTDQVKLINVNNRRILSLEKMEE